MNVNWVTPFRYDFPRWLPDYVVVTALYIRAAGMALLMCLLWLSLFGAVTITFRSTWTVTRDGRLLDERDWYGTLPGWM